MARIECGFAFADCDSKSKLEFGFLENAAQVSESAYTSNDKATLTLACTIWTHLDQNQYSVPMISRTVLRHSMIAVVQRFHQVF